ncbi:slipin family protein [bacterium]|nr:slipin family protein [bacterium]
MATHSNTAETKGSQRPRQSQFPEETPTTEFESNTASRGGVYVFYWLVVCTSTVLLMGIVALVTQNAFGKAAPLYLAVPFSIIMGFILGGTVRITTQWERAVVLRMGRFHKVAGPGVFLCIPFLDHVSIHIDQRMIASSFSAEAALTSDLVPVDVDAVLFWMVWDPKRACLEVENYPKAVLFAAQTALRDAIGTIPLSELSMRRKEIDRTIQEEIAPRCEEWGITITSVRIRDIKVPKDLEDALSKEAQAERERNARVILAEIEKDISDMYVEAANAYKGNETALKLRALSLAYEGARDGKGVLLVPSQLVNGFDPSCLDLSSRS